MSDYDIVVGIPSYNEEATISFVTRTVDEGLTSYFPDKRAIIINTDSCSSDRTQEVFENTPTKSEKLFVRVDSEIRGKGSNFRWLFNFVKEHNPKGIVVVDADLRSITPEWVKYLLETIFSGNDFATPYYTRHKYDGTITNNLCYPLVYGIMGYDIRQPIGGDFAFSKRLNDYWLEQEWGVTAMQYGIDIFMTLHAITGGFRISEVLLGSKIHNPSAPKLNEMFIQVADTLFGVIVDNISLFENRGLTIPRRSGLEKLGEAQDLDVDPEAILKKIIDSYELVDKGFLTPLWRERLDQMISSGRVLLTANDWVDLLFASIREYSLAANKRRVLELLRLLYFARTYSFIKESINMSTIEAESIIKGQAELLRSRREELFESFKKKLSVR